MLPQSLIGRVFLLYSVSILLLAGLGMGWWAQHRYQDSVDQAQDTANTILRLLGPATTEAVVIGDYDTIGRALEQAIKHADLDGAQFIDLKGGRIERNKAGDTELGHTPPSWLTRLISEQLPEMNEPVRAGGKDYGVLRLNFAANRIASKVWHEVLISAGLAVLALVIGNVIVWIPLNHWLGSLEHIRQFGEQMQVSGGNLAHMPDSDAPLEFRKTFKALNEAASSLQWEREQAAVTLSAIADGVATFNGQGLIVLVNPVLPKMLGVSASDLLGKRLQDVLPDQFNHLPAGAEWATRVRIVNTVGTELVLEINHSSINAGDELSGWVMAFRDVSQSQMLEDKLKSELAARSQAMQTMHSLLEGFADEASLQPEQVPATTDIDALLLLVTKLIDQLHERGEELAAIFSLSPDGFASFDTQHRVRYTSPAFSKLTGLSSKQAIGMQEDALLKRIVQGACRPLQAPTFAALRQSKHTIDIEQPVPRVLELALHTAAAGATSQVLHIRDVTHEVEVDRLKSEFLSTAAHELRTPITSVHGFTELLMTRDFPADKQRSMLERIHRQSSAMTTILNELLDLARIEARQGKDMQLEPISVQELIEEAMQDFQPPSGRATPLLDLQTSAVAVHGDRNKLLQVLRNLLSNAYKYSPHGGDVLIKVRTSVEDATESVHIACIDHGIGMTKEQCAHVTERFYRADKSGAIPGTGLGMSIVKEIMNLHAGKIDIDSTSGVGTCVTITMSTLAEEPLALSEV